MASIYVLLNIFGKHSKANLTLCSQRYLPLKKNTLMPDTKLGISILNQLFPVLFLMIFDYFFDNLVGSHHRIMLGFRYNSRNICM